MSQTTSKNSKTSSSRTEIRHVGVLLEHVNSKVSAVAEQFGDFKKEQSNQSNTLKQHSKILQLHSSLLESIVRDLRTKADKKDIVNLGNRVLAL